MSTSKVVIGERTFVPMISAEQIQNRIQELATQINQDFAGKEVIILCVLKGSILFTADLIRKLSIPVKLDFIRLSSYSEGTRSSGKIQELLVPGTDLTGQHVIVIEDIVDSGLTLEYLRKDLISRNVATSAIASLLFKPGNFKGNLPPEYIGFKISDEFVIGYGMDLAEGARQYDCIYQLQS